MLLLFHCHAPMHDVAPSAVTIAVAIDAIICTMNLMVSLFVIIFNFLPFYLFNFINLINYDKERDH